MNDPVAYECAFIAIYCVANMVHVIAHLRFARDAA
jgi:hypothetical protein